MPLLPIDRGPIGQARAALAESQLALDAARVEVALARTALGSALAQGDAAFRIDALKQAVTQGEAALAAVAGARTGLVHDIRGHSEGLLDQRDPGLMVQALRGDVPVALLPVRLETRYLDQGARLAIRIYPDTIHVMRHLRGLTEAERRGGQEYWTAAVAGVGKEETVWRRLVAAYRAPRAQFIVRATDPVNPDEAQAVTTLSRQSYAMLLPDRFCAVGYAAGRREVFREWGANVPDILPMSPELDPALATTGAAGDAIFGPDREWMRKFDAAVKVGMGLSITAALVAKRLRQRHDAQPFVWGSPLERLVVVGVDWTLEPEGAADALEELLEGHAASHGMAFAPLGTATNNTGRGASALNSGEVPPPPADAPLGPAAGATDAYDLTMRAFGLRGQTLRPSMVAGAGLAEQRTQMHMINALWRGTFGRYLDEMWNVSQINESYVSDATIDATRNFAVGWVRPGGPLPVLRIGKQPYGVLPVAAQYEPQDGIEAGIFKVLGFLRPAWGQALATVPRVDGKKLDEVRELVQSGPWSAVAKFRNIENPNKSVMVNGLTTQYGAAQTQSKAPVVRDMLAAFGIQQGVEVLLEHVVHDVQDHDLGYVPWVQAHPLDKKKARAPGDTLDPPFIAQIEAALGDEANAKTKLSKQQNGDSLLEALLAFSAEEEFDRSGLRLVDEALADGPHARMKGSLALSKSTPSFVGIAPVAAPSAFQEVTSTRALNDLKIPALTGGKTIAAHLASALNTAPALDAAVAGHGAANAFIDFHQSLPFVWRHTGALRASLKVLAPLKVGELDLAFRLTLDTFSYRLDAWFTGLASKRLEQLRKAREQAGLPLGLHLGAYGFVENLQRDTAPDSLGYTHAPSLTQAAAAALLRSGFLANAERGGEAFNIDLSSARVQKARNLIEGVERGQSPAALLGYRFERALRDTTNFVGAQYILDFRLRYPLRAAGTTLAEQPAEAIAARDVVDGLALLDAWRTGGEATVLGFVDNAHKPALRPVLADLAETWDAVSDVMVSESVYQLAQNNLERSAAAAAMLDAHASPISPQVTQTPRGGVSYAQRLMLLCASAPLPQAWADAAVADPRSAIEPRLDAWVARGLGAPSGFAFKALKMRHGALDGEIVLTPADLRRGPLSLVLGTALHPGDEGVRAAPLRRWLVEAFVRAAGVDADLQLDILERNGAGEPPGLAEFEALAGSLRALVAGVRALNRHDLVVPSDEFEATQADQGDYAGVDAAEIEGRATAALALLGDARQALIDAGLDDDAIAAALRACWPFGLRESEPAAPPVEAKALARWQEEHRARRDRVLAEIDERLATSTRLPPRGRTPAEEREPTLPEAIGIAIDRIKLVFGKDFPVLPVFTLGPYAASVAASLADRVSLLGDDPFALAGWLPKLARVRSGVDRLDAALTAHEVLHESSLADDLVVWQLPHVDQKAWAARPEAWAGKDIRKAVPQLAVVAAGADALVGLGADTALAGLTIDEWQEVIPDRMQTTGVSFHYDAPGARPPQAVLLAVPPRAAMAQWSFEEVLATVHEAFDLGQLRCVRPKDFVSGLGVFLPGNFLPQHFGAEVPSVELWQMAHKYAALASKTVALGKI
ncbi:MAG: hypothetical protein Q8K96_13780 [Rubrivivax sp.]|nr:hypothetical protein [Rubrivivax sp.]